MLFTSRHQALQIRKNEVLSGNQGVGVVTGFGNEQAAVGHGRKRAVPLEIGTAAGMEIEQDPRPPYEQIPFGVGEETGRRRTPRPLGIGKDQPAIVA